MEMAIDLFSVGSSDYVMNRGRGRRIMLLFVDFFALLNGRSASKP